MDAFFSRDGDTYIPSPLTRGPWNNDHQHGGPPAALLLGRIARFGERAADFEVARVWSELLRPVPIAPLTVEVCFARRGRTAQRLEARLFASDDEVMRMNALRLARTELDLPQTTSAPWPRLEDATPYTFTFFRAEVAYHTAIELRLAHGAWGKTPIGFWARPRVPTVAGETPSSLEKLITLADAQSGMGVPLDPHRYTFVNPDLSVHLERPPQGEWFGFDIRSTASATGMGLAQSEVRDRVGIVARTAQTLVVRPR